jgi:hypothetical protein
MADRGSSNGRKTALPRSDRDHGGSGCHAPAMESVRGPRQLIVQFGGQLFDGHDADAVSLLEPCTI